MVCSLNTTKIPQLDQKSLEKILAENRWKDSLQRGQKEPACEHCTGSEVECLTLPSRASVTL